MNVAERSSHEQGGTGCASSDAVGEQPRERSVRPVALCEGTG